MCQCIGDMEIDKEIYEQLKSTGMFDAMDQQVDEVCAVYRLPEYTHSKMKKNSKIKYVGPCLKPVQRNCLYGAFAHFLPTLLPHL